MATTLPYIDPTTLFQSLDQAFIVFDVDDPTFTVLEENNAHAKIAMTRREDVLGRPLLEAFPDTSEKYLKTGVSDLLESIRKVIRTGKPDDMPNLRYDLKDGKGKLTPKYWRVTHHPVFSKDKLIAVYQSTVDATDEILNEHKLNRLQTQLDQSLAYSSIGTWVWDISRGKIFADKNLSRLFGLHPAQIESGITFTTLLGMIHAQDRKRVEEKVRHVLANPGGFQSEFRIIDTHHTVHWVIARGRVETDEQGKAIGFPGVVVDITDRKRAENNLKFLTKATTQFSASLSYKATLQSIASLVVPIIADWCTVDLLNEQGQLDQVVVSHKDPEKVAWAEELRKRQGPPNLEDAYGVAKVLRTGEPEIYPDITDEMLEQMIPDKEQLELTRGVGMSSAIIAPLMVNNKPIGTITLIAAESRLHYKQTDVELVKGLANRAAQAVYNASLYQSAQREIKERKQLQAQLEALNEALESRVQRRTKQLEETNHGLEQEIAKRHEAEAVLQAYSDDLKRSNQELQDFAFVASHDLQEPLRKIQSFGDLLEAEYGSALGGGKEYLDRMRHAAARMSTLIEDLLAFSRITTKRRELAQVDLNRVVKDVLEDLDDRIARTHGSVQVKTLPVVYADPTHMRQLLQNLIGNALKFHRPDVPPIVTVRMKPTKKADKVYVLYVEDNGIGFDEKYLDRIFSVFQRLHDRTQYEGTGIGLAVCRRIVERYGGTITAESQKGKGSTFIISLPKEKKGNNND